MRLLILWVVFCLVLPGAIFSAAPAPKESAAIEAAEDFLALVDQGRYGESWDEAADLFVGRISKEEWQRTLAGVRPSLGQLVRRAVMSQQTMSSIPGAPDGDYVVILFSSSFAHKRAAVETVTVVREDDGQYRLAGYFIK